MSTMFATNPRGYTTKEVEFNGPMGKAAPHHCGKATVLVPVKVEKLKDYRVEIEGRKVVVSATSKELAFRLALSTLDLKPGTVNFSTVTEIKHEIGATR